MGQNRAECCRENGMGFAGRSVQGRRRRSRSSRDDRCKRHIHPCTHARAGHKGSLSERVSRVWSNLRGDQDACDLFTNHELTVTAEPVATEPSTNSRLTEYRICHASPPSVSSSSPDPRPELLSDRQYVVVLLRLLVDAEGHIVYGDAGGPEEHDSTVERWVHFRGPDGLLEAVRTWLLGTTDVAAHSCCNSQEGSERS